jgi:hypothetical protein
MARSIDGGNTFVNYKLSQTSFDPSPAIFFGDYVGISAYNNIVRPAWMEYNSGVLSVWTALVDGIALGIEDHAAASRSQLLEQNSPNPFSENTWIKFKLKDDAEVNLIVYDLLGNKVAVLYENEKFKAGNYDYIFNARYYDLSPGIYYYSLTCDKQVITKKMIVH